MSSRMGPRGTVLGAGQTHYQQYPSTQQYAPAPNAALLIDFDNVTMSIRSDLGKELKSLLRSDVIRGKVAVQRAYADWRRYPQYIVPLTESSVDLIFAPAYGSSKKNATDLRMAIDAIELVFTRPEIGTFILMTGDSDFSSCVLKLKEYGKYVIGVGMRESSSDLLIQNCDEYYSYHSISGLTKAGEVEESTEDPWSLVRRAVQRMVKDGDVMRTDRLKQVMIDLDPGFDEKKVGYSKFSRFVSEAASKGILHLKKAENGQYEILPEAAVDETAVPSRERVVERIVAEAAEAAGNGRRGRRGRGRDDRRESRPPRPIVTSEPSSYEPLELVEPESVVPAELVEVGAPAEPAVLESVPSVDGAAPADEAAVSGPALPELDEAYALLQEAVRRLGGRDGKAIRDGDVKRKMLEINGNFEESALGFAKFTRFLRQAHDAEVIDLNRVGAGNYEVTLPAGGRKLPPPRETSAGSTAAATTARPRREAPSLVVPEVKAPSEPVEVSVTDAPELTPPAERAAPRPSAPEIVSVVPPSPATTTAGFGGLRGRRGGRSAPAGPPPILPGQGVPSSAKPATVIVPELPTPTVDTVAPAEPEPIVEGSMAEPTVEETKGRGRSRRGRRGRGGRETASTTAEAADSPAAVSSEAEAAVGAEAPADTVVETPVSPTVEASAPEAVPAERTRSRGRRGRRSPAVSAPSEAAAEAAPSPAAERETAPEVAVAEAVSEPAPEDVAAPTVEKAAKASRRGRGRTRTAAKTEEVAVVEALAPPVEPPAKAPPTPPAFSAGVLGLPETPEEITGYLTTKYKGIGKKTVETLLGRFGVGVFAALQERPEDVRSALDERRGNALLEQWAADYAKRSAAVAPAPTPDAEPVTAPAKRSRGGRGGGRKPAARKPAS